MALVMGGALSCAAEAPPADSALIAREASAFADASAQDPEQNATESAWAAQKLIRTGAISLEVDSVAQVLGEIEIIAEELGGIVADTDINRNSAGRQSGRIVLRVPVENYGTAIERLRAVGRVTREASATEDVTRAYTDLETRLAVKEEAAARLRQLLSTRTGDLADVLAVERELSRVITEIEQIKGERRYFDQRIALSTIEVSVFEIGTVMPRRPGSVGDALARSIAALGIAAAWAVYLGTFVAPWVVVVAMAWFGVRWLRQKRGAA